MGASRWKVFTTVTLPLMLPGLGNAFLVTFIESVADFANPMMIGGSFDTLATTIYLQVTGGSYDKTGAAAMAVVLLSLDAGAVPRSRSTIWRARRPQTLTGKASRERMLITDTQRARSADGALLRWSAVFVIMMYVCHPLRRAVQPVGTGLLADTSSGLPSMFRSTTA